MHGSILLLKRTYNLNIESKRYGIFGMIQLSIESGAIGPLIVSTLKKIENLSLAERAPMTGNPGLRK